MGFTTRKKIMDNSYFQSFSQVVKTDYCIYKRLAFKSVEEA